MIRRRVLTQTMQQTPAGDSWPIFQTVFLLAIAACWATVCSGEELKSSRMIVDFENRSAIARNDLQVRSQLVSTGTGHALQIVSEARPDYPSVMLKPSSGKWNLAGFDAVEMDVRNPQDVPVRVLLSLLNPDADGTRNCNTEAVDVPAHGKGTVVVPYGMWHGQSGNNIDWSNIIAMQVMLDKPRRTHTFSIDNIRAVKYDRMTIEEALADPFFQQLKPGYGRGVNLGNALEAPKEGQWGVTLQEEYFDLIKSAGFDNVRIPICWSAHAEESAPYRIDPVFLKRVDWVVQNCLKRRLIPIVNMHHYHEVMEKPVEHRERFIALWQQIATHYKDYPSALSLELLNEPHGNLNADEWNSLLAATLQVVRRTNPTRKVVIGPADWNSLKKLASLKLPEDDRNLVVTFHYYDPFEFTHQGAGWVSSNSNAWLGTRWTGTQAEKDAVVADFNKAIVWAVQHRRPIYLGEFGAYSKADLASRTRWTRFIAEEARKRKMSSAYWEFCASFGVYDPDRRAWVEPLRAVLLGAD